MRLAQAMNKARQCHHRGEHRIETDLVISSIVAIDRFGGVRWDCGWVGAGWRPAAAARCPWILDLDWMHCALSDMATG